MESHIGSSCKSSLRDPYHICHSVWQPNSFVGLHHTHLEEFWQHVPGWVLRKAATRAGDAFRLIRLLTMALAEAAA